MNTLMKLNGDLTSKDVEKMIREEVRGLLSTVALGEYEIDTLTHMLDDSFQGILKSCQRNENEEIPYLTSIWGAYIVNDTFILSIIDDLLEFDNVTEDEVKLIQEEYSKVKVNIKEYLKEYSVDSIEFFYMINTLDSALMKKINKELSQAKLIPANIKLIISGPVWLSGFGVYAKNNN